MTPVFSELIAFVKTLPSTFSGLLSSTHGKSEQGPRDGVLEDLFVELHFFNTCLWNEEDLARRTKVTDSEIAKNKRAIDRFNQSRNDLIERIDSSVLDLLRRSSKIGPQSIRSSETAGSMVDRISILSLKIHHMGLQTKRPDVDEHHRQTAQNRLGKLHEQRDDLVESLVELLEGMCSGTRHFKVYRQFKMYNDPKFNPALVAERGHET